MGTVGGKPVCAWRDSHQEERHPRRVRKNLSPLDQRLLVLLESMVMCKTGGNPIVGGR